MLGPRSPFAQSLVPRPWKRPLQNLSTAQQSGKDLLRGCPVYLSPEGQVLRRTWQHMGCERRHLAVAPHHIFHLTKHAGRNSEAHPLSRVLPASGPAPYSPRNGKVQLGSTLLALPRDVAIPELPRVFRPILAGPGSPSKLEGAAFQT